MIDRNSAAIADIRATFDDLVQYGLDTDEILGAGDDLIDAMARQQNAPAVPAAVREIFRLIGRQPGRFDAVGTFRVSALDSEDKKAVRMLLDEGWVPPNSSRYLILIECLSL